MTLPALQGKRHADDTRRDGRLRLRSWLWDHTSAVARLRVNTCGRAAVSQFVEIKASPGSAGLGGVATCGSVWACPMCSAKVAQKRAEEVQSAIRAWQARGGSVLLVTLTLQHSRRHELSKTWDAIGRGWASVRNGSGWKAAGSKVSTSSRLTVQTGQGATDSQALRDNL